MTEIPKFEATKRGHWLIDNTSMALVTNAEIPLGQLRKTMQNDLQKAAKFEIRLPVEHWSDSFQGTTGTHIHGCGWMLHVPQDGGDLWKQAALASLCDWTEIAL